jgi:hypothetical protein
MTTLAVVLTATVVCIAFASVCLAWSPKRGGQA